MRRGREAHTHSCFPQEISHGKKGKRGREGRGGSLSPLLELKVSSHASFSGAAWLSEVLCRS